ncbi:hypothetical protein PD716_16150 [Vibrio gigantis]|uniref:hypothetical protein n=1 Tax=Vibrio gigantis TaxID=296199 RepID=UPI002FC9ACC4
MSNYNGFFKYIYLVLSKGYATSIGILVLIFTNEMLGFSTRGEIAIAITWVSVFFTVLYLSLGQIGYKIVVDDKRKINEVVTALLIYTAFMTALIYLISPIVYVTISPINSLDFKLFLIALSIFPMMMLEQQFTSLFLSVRDTNKMNKINIFSKSVFLLLSLIFISFYPSFLTYIVCVFLGHLFTVTFLYRAIFENNSYNYTFDIKVFKYMLKKGSGFHFYNAFGYIAYSYLPMIVLPYYIDNETVAKYELSFKLLALFAILASSCQLLGMRLFSSSCRKSAWVQYCKLVFFYFFLSLLIAVIVKIIINYYLDSGYYEQYHESVMFVNELLYYIPFMFTSIFLPTLFLNFDMLKMSARYNVVFGLVSLISMFHFISKYDEGGIVIAMRYIYLSSGFLFFICLAYIYVTKVRND